MRISIPRGDIRWQRFLVKTEEDKITSINFTNIYFTVKKNAKDKTYIFQKSLRDGNIVRLADGDYEVRIDSEDTNSLAYGNYKFDIQLNYKTLIKETFVGDFVVTEEITFIENESYTEEDTDAAFSVTPHQDSSVIVVPDYHEIELVSPEIMAASSYTDVSNKPQINGITLQGNMSLEELGIQPAGPYPSEAFTAQEIDELLAEEEG